MSGIIVLLNMSPKKRKVDYNKNKKAQKITHTLAIFVDLGIMAHTYHDGLANENSRIALSNDPVFNNNGYLYRIAHQCKSTLSKGVLSKITYISIKNKMHHFV